MVLGARPIRKLLSAREPGMLGLGLTQKQLRTYLESQPQSSKLANLSPIKLPSNPLGSTQPQAAAFAREQVMKKFSELGVKLSRQNTMKSMSRVGSGSSGLMPNLNFIPTRGTSSSSPSWFQRNKGKLLDAAMGIGGTAGLLGIASSVISQIPMPFAMGGGINRFDGSMDMFSAGNPIRVSDGELGIPRGLVDKLGAGFFKKLNSGDLSGIGGFASGGLLEFDGPGSGTSDSILMDADRGPRGKDASDIGFVIRRSVADKIKNARGYALGGNVLDQFSQFKGQKYMSGKGYDNMLRVMQSDAVGERSTIDEVLDAIFSDKGYFKDTVQKNQKSSPNFAANARNAIGEALGKTDLANITKDQEDDRKSKDAEDKHTDAVNRNTVTLNKYTDAIDDAIAGVYRGEMGWTQNNLKEGERYIANVQGMDETKQANPDYMPNRDQLFAMDSRHSGRLSPRSEMGDFSDRKSVV